MITNNNIEFEDNKIGFNLTTPVLLSHVNYGNHLSHVSLVSILEETRETYLLTHEMSQIAIVDQVGMLVIDLNVNYSNIAYHRDELCVSIYFSCENKKLFGSFYKVENINTNKIIATAQINHLFYDQLEKRVVDIPAKIISSFNLPHKF